MRLSKAGLALSVTYAAIAVPLLVAGYIGVSDPKGEFVLKQLAVIPAILLVGVLKLGELLIERSMA